MGMEVSTHRHVEHLHAATDAQERNVGSRERGASQLDLEAVALFRHAVDLVVVAPA